MTSSTPLLQIQALRVDVGERTVLRSVHLDVAAGSLVVLMGANGSGKSTLGMAGRAPGVPRGQRPGAAGRHRPAHPERA